MVAVVATNGRLPSVVEAATTQSTATESEIPISPGRLVAALEPLLSRRINQPSYEPVALEKPYPTARNPAEGVADAPRR